MNIEIFLKTSKIHVFLHITHKCSYINIYIYVKSYEILEYISIETTNKELLGI